MANETRKGRHVHWSQIARDVSQLVFDGLKQGVPNGDAGSETVQIPMREYSRARDQLLYSEFGSANPLMVTDAIAMITIVAFTAGRGRPETFESQRQKFFEQFEVQQQEILKSRAEEARQRKLPVHLLDRIVIEEMEDTSLPELERATSTKSRRELLLLAERKREAINARIAAERKRYNLPTDEPYYQEADSIYRRYRDAKKRTLI